MTLANDHPRSVSLREVAQAAGVSGQTVSRVANNAPNVAEPTRQKVLAAMADLGYRPNVAARALRRGSFGSIGVVVFTLGTLGNIRTIAGIVAEAARRDYAVELIQVQPGTEEGEREGQVSSALSRLGQDAVDGIIVIIESHLISKSALVFPDGIPSIIVEAGARPDRPSINADQINGARLAVRHLLDLGHPTVWHVAGPSESNSARERTETWREILEHEQRAVPEPFLGDWSADSGYRAGLALADLAEATAVFASNDQMALGVLRALHERGVRVPDDVSVVGFDDMDEAAHFWPPLTTVHQFFEDAGSLAVSLIIDEIQGRDLAPGVRTVATELVVRQSTGPYTGPRPVPPPIHQENS
ncbi:LacI family DNA-binding transcriptional regulator [Microbacterium sp. LjRoot45]|uniref:LacI family DNA-binding transcriptional regulator n=1 Tax=Microbacterium sp. LjRoot45 TaxID=3342329 RepID=UPI003ECC7F7F